MTTIMHAAGAAELLAAIPVLTGFTPRESLVLLPFRGSRTVGALRFDLPAPPLADFAATAVGLARRVPGTDAVAIAVYTAQAPPAADGCGISPGLPVADVVADVTRCAAANGLRVVEALHVGDDGWADYADPDAPPHPLAEIPAAPPIPGFAGPAPDQLSGAALPSPGLFETESVGRALLAVERVLGPAGPGRKPAAAGTPIDPRAQQTALLLDDLPAFLEEVLDAPQAQSPFATAALVWILNRPSLRDVALVQWARDLDQGDVALAAQLSYGSGRTPVPAQVAGALIGLGPRPDPDRLGVALTLLRRTIALAPRPARGGPLAAAAWLSWASGRSTHAAHYLDLLDAIDPDLSFARLLRSMLQAGMLPEWAFTSPAGTGSSRGCRAR